MGWRHFTVIMVKRFLQFGASTQVRDVSAAASEYLQAAGYWLDISVTGISKNMTEEEQNTNAAFYSIRREENHGNEPLAYDSQFGGGTFGDDLPDHEKYAKHPEETVTMWGHSSDAAGAYQIMSYTYKALVKQGVASDFSPDSQDAMAVALIASRGALLAVQSGNGKEYSRILSNEWTSLPGGPHSGNTVEEMQRYFNDGVLLQIQDKSLNTVP